MSSALLLSMACSSPDSHEPTDPSNTEASASTPKEAPIGQPIAARDVPDVGDLVEVDIKDYVPNLNQSSSPLVDKANILACNINFNDSLALTILPDKAWHTFALLPFYIQNCGDGWHWVYTRPKNMDHYHLGFEFQSTYNFCQGTPYKVGQQIGGSCANQRDASLWPRNASNMQSGSGIEFYARTYDNISKLFDLKSLRILSGPAIIKVYRTDISSWWQWELPAGTWTFPFNSTKLRYLQVFHKNFNGIFTIDDVKLDVHRL